MGVSKQLSTEKITRLQELRHQGHSQYEIAHQLGIAQSTVSRYLTDSRRKTKTRKDRKDIAKLKDRCRELRRKGHTQGEIGAALGIRQETVSGYLRDMGEPRMRIRRPTKSRGVSSLLDSPPLAAYHRSVTLSLLSSVERELRELNAEHCFAGDVADAQESSDTVWLRNAEITLASAQEYLNRLHAVLADEEVQLGNADCRDDVAQIAKYRNRRDRRDRRWTDEEIAIVMREDISIKRMAQMLGRSESSVGNLRWRMRQRVGTSK